MCPMFNFFRKVSIFGNGKDFSFSKLCLILNIFQPGKRI